jgi:hypothetical protein
LQGNGMGSNRQSKAKTSDRVSRCNFDFAQKTGELIENNFF